MTSFSESLRNKDTAQVPGVSIILIVLSISLQNLWELLVNESNKRSRGKCISQPRACSILYLTQRLSGEGVWHVNALKTATWDWAFEVSVQVSIALELSGINHKSVPGCSALSEGVGDFFLRWSVPGLCVPPQIGIPYTSMRSARVSEIDRWLCPIACAGLLTSGLYGYQWGKPQRMHAWLYSLEYQLRITCRAWQSSAVWNSWACSGRKNGN